MLSIGNRVKTGDMNFGFRLGTVTKASQFGYVRVQWDNGTEGNFPPMSANTELEQVFGDDALPRHEWYSINEMSNPYCTKCKVEQTDENEFGPCR